MNGSEYIAEFLKRKQMNKIFLVTGGAVAFVVAIGELNFSEYVCVQHEQTASMAADAVWRTAIIKQLEFAWQRVVLVL